MPCSNRFVAVLALILAGIFAVPNASHAQTIEILHTFLGIPTDSVRPIDLIQGGDGAFYGTTNGNGGMNGDYGCVFRLTSKSVFKILYRFAGASSGIRQGYEPISLIQGHDGNFYGITIDGIVFQVTPRGAFKILHTITPAEGSFATPGLIQARDGNLYGTTYSYGAPPKGTGVIFQLSTAGAFRILRKFTGSDAEGGPYGLLEGRDGSLFGMTYGNGADTPDGMIFQITTSGAFRTLYQFTRRDSGAFDPSSLIQGRDGNLYGTTWFGGLYGSGTVFQLTIGGALKILHSFNGQQISPFDPPADGAQPRSLIQARDGSLYALVHAANSDGRGSLCQLTTGGAFRVLTSFDMGGMSLNFQSGDGNFYGTRGPLTASDGGTIYRFVMDNTPAPKIVLQQATTMDAQSVTVQYTISQANVTHPLQFDFYRSATPTMDSASTLLGTQILYPQTDAAALTQGAHTVQMLKGAELTPNPKLPYIVVVANGNTTVHEDINSINTTYFRKYLLGVVTHGYDLTSRLYFFGAPAWMITMQKDLVTFCHFDTVISVNWTPTSAVAAPNQATNAGDAMYARIVLEVSGLLKRHKGDVVDIHLIGHSRGTVVVSRALQDLSGVLVGSYVEVTLLDPHPANNADGTFVSDNGSLAGHQFVSSYTDFQAKAQDPEIVLPAHTGILAVDAYYQQTPAKHFPLTSPGEAILNLWGEGQNDGTIINRSGVPIKWVNLTDGNVTGVGMIGHTEVHEYYRIMLVDTGVVH